MTSTYRSIGLFIAVFMAGASVASCAGGYEIPQTICGVKVDRNLTRHLVSSDAGFREYDRVDRSSAISAPCLLIAENDAVLRFRFSWDEVPMNLMYLATGTGSVSGVTDPRSIDFVYKTVLGTDGAISTAPCKTKGGNYFTLTLQLPQVRQQDYTHRKDIERFMRAYFPATLKTLGCEKGTRPQKASSS
ncbi:hypothetical protein [Streptomyces sp. NPDC047000]|uniref:hypothetical protein n=1 Tax=Streptomyces sp. NPDC047000 TaxID=3155474 RepID=UPI0033CF2B67